jgi:ATP-dependent DNA ligase
VVTAPIQPMLARLTRELPVDGYVYEPKWDGFRQLDGRRFRHPARFRRWRPDRDASSCTIEQLDVEPADMRELLPLP